MGESYGADIPWSRVEHERSCTVHGIYIYSNNNYGKYEFVIFLIIPRPLLIRKMAMWGNDVIRSRSRT